MNGVAWRTRSGGDTDSVRPCLVLALIDTVECEALAGHLSMKERRLETIVPTKIHCLVDQIIRIPLTPAWIWPGICGGCSPDGEELSA